jgi:hypothetical protein
MASLRSGTRKDGSSYVQVLYRLEGKQTSTSFEDMTSAVRFQRLADKFGAAKALMPVSSRACLMADSSALDALLTLEANLAADPVK